jgi:Protein of unknown function (DUF3501)
MLTRESLYNLETYAKVRKEFRAKVIAHKKIRLVELGAHASIHFEDQLTMQYQVQEMLRLERIFEPALIQEELDVYNPLVPDGSNWKATLMFEYPDAEERGVALARLIGVEACAYVEVADFARVTPFANEDLDRTTAEKTSAVHFLRFELAPDMVAAAKGGAPIRVGIDHPHYKAEITLPPATRESLVADLT